MQEHWDVYQKAPVLPAVLVGMITFVGPSARQSKVNTNNTNNIQKSIVVIVMRGMTLSLRILSLPQAG